MAKKKIKTYLDDIQENPTEENIEFFIREAIAQAIITEHTNSVVCKYLNDLFEISMKPVDAELFIISNMFNKWVKGFLHQEYK